MGRPYTQESLAYFRLARTQGLGSISIGKMIQAYGTAASALAHLPSLIKASAAGRVRSIFTKAQAERELGDLKRLGGSFITPADEDYPPLLRHVEDRPYVLSILGHPALCRKKMLAVVGTRFMSVHAESLTSEWVRILGAAGFLIVSGMARGVDATAHRAALPYGTLAVLAGGVDVVYPQENKKLYDQLIAEGAVISEMPLGQSITAYHFPKRNRIIAAMARATIVMEAAKRSGSLLTARFAFEYGRDVFAVPGAPQNERHGGCNELIRMQMALLADSAESILDSLTDTSVHSPPSSFAEGSKEAAPNELPDTPSLRSLEAYLLDILTETPLGIDTLYDFVGRHYGEVPFRYLSVALVSLDLAGKIVFEGGNRVARLKDRNAVAG